MCIHDGLDEECPGRNCPCPCMNCLMGDDADDEDDDEDRECRICHNVFSPEDLNIDDECMECVDEAEAKFGESP